MNCTPTTPTLSEAVALRVTVPDSVAPLAGAVRLTVGATVSGVVTVTVTVEVRCCRRRRGLVRSACGCRWRPWWCSTTRCRAGLVSSAPSGVAVHQELHPGHPDIVGGGGAQGHRARHGRAVGGSGEAHRGCRDVRIVDGDGPRRGGGVAGGVAGSCGQRVGAVGDRGGVPRHAL